MTGPTLRTTLRATLGRLGLTQVEAARMLGTIPNTVSRWVRSEQPVPHWVERELWLAETVPGVVEAMRGRAGLP